MNKLILSLSMIFAVNFYAQASQCSQSPRLAEKLASIVDGVIYVSETDDTWSPFYGAEPVNAISESEIKRVLKLSDTYQNAPAHFSLDSSSALYSFLNQQISLYEDEDVYADKLAAAKLKKLADRIYQEFGSHVRIGKYGEGDGDIFFVGERMLILVLPNGCVLGLQALTVWT